MAHHYPALRRHDNYEDSMRSIANSRASWQERQLTLSTIDEVSSANFEAHETFSLRMEAETKVAGGNSGHSSVRSQPDSGIGYNARGQTPRTDNAETESGDRSFNGGGFIWDFAETVPEEYHPPCCAYLGERLIKVARVGTYIVIFAVVLVSSLSSQLTFRFMAHGLNAQNVNSRKKEHHIYLLALSLSIPDILSFITALYRRLRGKRSTLKWRRCLLNLVLETVHLAALYGLTFRVVPAFSYAEMTALISVAASVPALAVTVTVWREKRGGAAIRTLHLLAFLAQVVTAAVFSWKIVFNGTLSLEVQIWATVSLFTFSLRWLKSYVPGFGATYANDNFSLLLSAAARVVIGGILLKGYLFQQLGDPIQAFQETYSETSKSLGRNRAFLSLFAPFLVHLTSTWLCYYLAVIACKLLMQRVGFLLPLCASTLAYFFLELFIPNVAAILFDGAPFSSNVPGVGERSIVVYVSFGVGFLSQLWIFRQCWSETDSARLAFTRSLFVVPHYCALSPQLHLLHSRRRQQLTSQDNDVDKSSGYSPPFVHACATMWHETETEMTQLLKSLMRLDKFQCIERIRYEDYNKKDAHRFHFEGHILFDDAMTDQNGSCVPNEYVKTFLGLIDNVASATHKRPLTLKKVMDVPTPYGRQIQWKMCGGNNLVVHLKDKTKIKIKKRWSQVMYMYYLLNFCLSRKLENKKDGIAKWVIDQANNVFLLALDGDVKFEPEAVMLLVDRMRKNKDVGAACGRIKPQGTGPVVWYQKFEYAVGHWLQKSAEHVFGCVLCSPGCFSLFRGSALLDPNVLHTYTRNARSAMDHLQCDQGEDRWLCTLILKRGHRVEYCAVSEALTFAPEEFKEFFNQRRRWGPSTMANIMDLILSWSSVVRRNHSISHLYMFYIVVLFVSSVLGPATVLLAIQSSMASVFSLQSWLAYLLSYGPTVLFVVVCLKARAETQLNLAMALSAVFALVMMAVIVGTVVNIAQEGWYSPNGMFLYVLIGCTLLAGIFHPHELSDLVWGGLYFLCVPAGYLFLTIYTICNLNVVSWGTRETKSINAQHDECQEGAGGDRKSRTIRYLDEATGLLTRRLKDDNRISQTCCGAFTSLFRQLNFTASNTILVFILHALNRLEADRGVQSGKISTSELPDPDYDEYEDTPVDASSQTPSADATQTRDVGTLSQEEQQFWKDFIAKYLEPEQPENEEKRLEEEDKKRAMMLDLRNKWAFVFFFCNGLWLVVISALQEVKANLNVSWKPTENGSPILLEPLGLLYLAVFAILLLLQMSAMISHRYGALLHSIAFVKLQDSQKQRDKLFQKHFDNPLRAELETATPASAVSTLHSVPNGTIFTAGPDSQLTKEFEDYVIKRLSNDTYPEYQPHYDYYRSRGVSRRQEYDMYATYKHRLDQFNKTRRTPRARPRDAVMTQHFIEEYPE